MTEGGFRIRSPSFFVFVIILKKKLKIFNLGIALILKMCIIESKLSIKTILNQKRKGELNGAFKK